MRKIIPTFVVGLWLSMGALAQSPVPFITQPLIPDVVAPGSSSFTLTVHGAGFLKGAVVEWNRAKLNTRFSDSRTLQATIPANLVRTSTTGLINVVNAGTKVRSNSATLPVTTPEAAFRITGGGELETIDSPVGIATADFDGDGKLDYVSTVDIFSAGETNYAKSVLVAYSSGTGAFRIDKISLGQRPGGVVAGDFNNDGQTDFAVVLEDLGVASVEIFLQNNGFFHSIGTTPAGILPTNLVAGDFNRDGNLDLAVEDRDGSSVVILLGTGDGSLTAGQTFPVSTGPVNITMEDFNGDGILDLAIPTQDNDVSVALGVGDGTFGTVTNYGAGFAPACATTSDFNGDGIPDLAVVNASGIGILLGNGDGSFQQEKNFPTGQAPTDATSADLDGDGHLDIVVTTEQGISFLRGNGDGTFQKNVNVDRLLGRGPIVAGDFRIDGRLDLEVNAAGGAIYTLLQ
ncbi:MAG: VCBS repeat-containing protein [Acidobacteriales bacterium]|nr:VCBS repeat-containing protein [Terriglobales bacterium]